MGFLKGTLFKYYFSARVTQTEILFVRPALCSPANLNHLSPWHTPAYLIFLLVYSLNQVYLASNILLPFFFFKSVYFFFHEKKRIMRYIVSKFCEGCSPTKLFWARGDFFADKCFNSAVPTFTVQECRHWWFGLISCVSFHSTRLEDIPNC